MIFWENATVRTNKNEILMIAKSMQNLPRGRDFSVYSKPSLILYVSKERLKQ